MRLSKLLNTLLLLTVSSVAAEEFKIDVPKLRLTNMKMVGNFYFIAGTAENSTDGSSFVYSGKVRSSDGSLTSFESFGRPSKQDSFYLAVDEEGDVYVAGLISGPFDLNNPSNTDKITLTRYNGAGQRLWTYPFSSIGGRLYSVLSLRSGIILGGSSGDAAFPGGFFSLHSQQNGTQLRSLQYSAPSEVKTIVADSLETYIYVAIDNLEDDSTSLNAYRIENFEPVWGLSVKEYSNIHTAELLLISNDMYWAINGLTSGSSSDKVQLFLYRVNPSGTEIWRSGVNTGEGDDVSTSLGLNTANREVYLLWTTRSMNFYAAKFSRDDGSLQGQILVQANSMNIESVYLLTERRIFIAVVSEGSSYFTSLDPSRITPRTIEETPKPQLQTGGDPAVFISLIIVFSILIVLMVAAVIVYLLRQAKMVEGASTLSRIKSNSKNDILRTPSKGDVIALATLPPEDGPALQANISKTNLIARSGSLKSIKTSNGSGSSTPVPPLPQNVIPAKPAESLRGSPQVQGSPRLDPRGVGSLPISSQSTPLSVDQKLRKSLPKSTASLNAENDQKLRKTNPLYSADVVGPEEPPMPVIALPSRQTNKVTGNPVGPIVIESQGPVYATNPGHNSPAISLVEDSPAPKSIRTSDDARNPAVGTGGLPRDFSERSKIHSTTNSIQQAMLISNHQMNTPSSGSRRISNVPNAQQSEYSFFEGNQQEFVTGPFAPLVNNQMEIEKRSSVSSEQTQPDFTTTFTQVHTVISNQRELALPGFLQYKVDIDFNIRQQLAKGGSGSVFLAKILTPELRNRANGSNLCVAKVLNNQSPSKEEIDSFSQEISIMWFFRTSRNFAKLLGFTTAPPTIIMKQYPRGSLGDLIYHDAQNIEWTSQLIFFLLRDVASGLKEMHEAGFAHCDIKPGNILIDEDDSGVFAVLSDFGISRVVTNSVLLVQAFKLANIDGVSVIYAAPEVLRKIQGPDDAESVNPEIVKASDVYSFAMVSYEIINRKQPWPKGKPAMEIIQRVLRGERPVLTDEVREKKQIDRRLAGLCEIMEQCWVDEPKARLQMKWITEILDQIQNSSVTR